MAMKKGEQEASDRTKKAVNEAMAEFFSAARYYLRLPEEQVFSRTGYKTKEAAVIAAFQHSQEKIDKLWKDFFKQFPDER